MSENETQTIAMSIEDLQKLQEMGILHIQNTADVDTESDEKNTEEIRPQKRKRKRKIRVLSEKLNKRMSDFSVYTDTRNFLPGVVVYIIEKNPPTFTKPYVTYKPAMRIITGMHDNGVNNGTVFFTYNHKFIKTLNHGMLNKQNNYNVLSEEETIYSPLTWEQAKYTCELLNLQSKNLYLKSLKLLKRAKDKTK